jgi:hypothetical protein
VRIATGGYRTIVAVALLAALAIGTAACDGSGSALSAVTIAAANRPATNPTAPLSAPKTSPTQDARYLADVAKADDDLVTYVQAEGNVALQAMLTDGTAFCAFLHRGGGLDNALVSVAIGAKSVESQTHLPVSVKTFNTMDAVALLTLCPSEQRLVPPSVRSKIRKLGSALGS